MPLVEPVLILKSGRKLNPPSTLAVPHSSTRLLLPLLRQSYQTTPTSPVIASSAILEKNWLLEPASVLTRSGLLQLPPSLSEKRVKMFRSLLEVVGASV